MHKGDLEKAKQEFEISLKLYPTYEIAQKALKSVNERLAKEREK